MSDWQRAEAQALGPPRRLHIPSFARRRARVGIRGSAFAAVRSSAPPRAGGTLFKLDSSEGHPAFLARRAEDLAWAVPATWGTRSCYLSPCASLRSFSLLPFLSIPCLC